MLDATAQRASRRPICCRVWTDEGFYGDGEAGIAFDYAAPAGIGMLQDISRLVIGKDPMRTDEVWERMFKVSFWGQGGGPVVFAAISAIDIALMDIKGKVLNVPVYELLGGKVNDSIRCYASQLQFGWNEDVGPRGTAKEYADICKYAMEDGYDAVKLDFTLYDRDKKDIPNRAAHLVSLIGIGSPIELGLFETYVLLLIMYGCSSRPSSACVVVNLWYSRRVYTFFPAV